MWHLPNTVRDVASHPHRKQDKAPGDDGITPKFFKEAADEIAEPLTEIFNKSVSEGVVPQDWKIANVAAIFKKGTKLDSGNYRPVSHTSHIDKTFRIIN